MQSRGNRVVGGTEAQPNSWPWMAALVRGNYYVCGAVLIDEQFALTAAHCVVDRYVMGEGLAVAGPGDE